MKKNIGKKNWMFPMPVLMIGTYGADGTPNVMNAAWGGITLEGELDLPQECELVLQLAVQGLDIPRPLDMVRALIEQCRMTWK